MTASAASGERSALRGYRWQYDHVAALVYDALLDDDLVALRLTDPAAGKVDDLVLVTRSRVIGHQFKNTEFDGFITFTQLVANQRNRSGNPIPSLMRALADGWQLLRTQYGLPVHVRLVANRFASPNDHLTAGTDELRVSPDHFQAFVDRVLDPLRTGRLALVDVPNAWRPALSRFSGCHRSRGWSV